MGLSATSLDVAIKSVMQTKKEQVVWDESITGLGARVSPKGKASFILMYRFHGCLRKLTIGRYGNLTISQARDLAKKYHAEVIAGSDPALKKIAARQGNTMADLCRRYIKDHACKKSSGKEDIQKIHNSIIPEFGNRKIASITFQDMARFHKNYGAPIQANRCISLLSKMFTLAKEWGFLDRAAVNPCSGIKKNEEISRKRYIRQDEMPKILAGINKEEDPFIKGALLISLFTGIRQHSVMSLKWSSLDIPAELLFELEAKTSKEGEVVTHHLTKAAVNAFNSVPRVDNEEHVFLNGLTIYGQTTRLREAWERVKKDAGISEVEGKLKLHDMRRTIGSWLATNNYSLSVGKEALNHKSDRAAHIYQRLGGSALVKNAMEDITQKMIDTLKN